MGTNGTLCYPRLWQTLGWLWVASICWLSLTPSPPEPPEILAWDKAQHFLAYGLLMLWYGQAFGRHWYWPLFLVVLGVGLEVLQGWSGLRTFDPFDILANTLGVMLGLAVVMLLPRRMGLAGLDGWLARTLARNSTR